MPKVIQVRNFYSINEDEWRVLSAVETGMRNHEYVQLDMVHKYAGIHHSGKNFVNILRSTLVPHRLISYENNGYRLTNLGYDFLALRKFIKSNIAYDLSNFQLFGTGKESDLYICKSGPICHQEFGINSEYPIVLKFHRLGRTSFKQVKNKREYKTGNNCSWLYMNRISATREFNTMKELFEAKIPVPIPIGQNRGAVAMEYINSVPLFKFSRMILENGAAELLFNQAKYLLIKMAELGLVHGDLNEFNLLVEVGFADEIKTMFNNTENLEKSSECDSSSGEDSDDDEEEESQQDHSNNKISEDNENLECSYQDQDINTFKLRMIDFPQVISRNNKTAQEIYERDRHGIISYFQKFTKIPESNLPPENLEEIERIDYLDVKLKAPGFPKNVCRESDDNDEDDENKVGKESKSIKLDEIKKRVNKEKSKQIEKNRIHKQQRNIRKNDCKKDLKDDIFQ